MHSQFLGHSMPNYTDVDFFGFFRHFFGRVFSGQIMSLASDEIQILALSGIAVTACIAGTFLVLRNMTMLANALSHTLLVGIILSYMAFLTFHSFEPGLHLSVTQLFIAALIAGLLTTFLTEFLKKALFVQEDASIGLVFTTLFALGILLVSVFAKNHHVGLDLVMGNVDALKKEDLKGIYLTLFLNVTVFVLFFKEFNLTTFDGSLARTLGLPPFLFNLVLMLLTSLTAIAAFQAVGVLMVLAFFVIPPLTARLFVKSLKAMICVSGLIGAVTSFLAVALSRHILTVSEMGLSTGGIAVVLLSCVYVGGLILKKGIYGPKLSR